MLSWKELVASEQQYASCFCEENVYCLAKRLTELKQVSEKEVLEGVEFFVIFISNRIKQTPIWFQKAAVVPGEEVVWDYHVVLCSKSSKLDETLVFDLDTLLSFPCPAVEYIGKSFKPQLSITTKYRQMFRVIEASKFLRNFASDRSHMVNSGKQPPGWPYIRGIEADTPMNLSVYWDMTQHLRGTDERYGSVYTLGEFMKWSTEFTGS